jgi:hypothetical protein
MISLPVWEALQAIPFAPAIVSTGPASIWRGPSFAAKYLYTEDSWVLFYDRKAATGYPKRAFTHSRPAPTAALGTPMSKLP